jgi:hypothetical protein
MTLQKSRWMLGPEGRSSKLQPSPWGSIPKMICHPAWPGVPWEPPAFLWQVEKEMTLQKSRWMLGPEGRSSKLQPSPEGLGTNPEDDLSAVGAVLNLCPLPPVSLSIFAKSEKHL